LIEGDVTPGGSVHNLLGVTTTIYLFDSHDTFKNALYIFEILVRDISDMNIDA
jgi:hypothetical protein